MTEDEARRQVELIVGPTATRRLDRLAALVIAENERQNLIARSTVDAMWSRHILDSIQLLPLAADLRGLWLDIGTGGGFPGLAVTIAAPRQMILVEPRRQRTAFLSRMVQEFGLTDTRVVQSRVELVDPMRASIISARAVAAIGPLFESSLHCATSETQWLLPRGAGWQSDIAAAKSDWKAMFHVEQSRSDPAAKIVIATNVRRR